MTLRLGSGAVILNLAPSAVGRPVSEVQPTLVSRGSAPASRRSTARDYEQALSTLIGLSGYAKADAQRTGQRTPPAVRWADKLGTLMAISSLDHTPSQILKTDSQSEQASPRAERNAQGIYEHWYRE